MKLYKTERIDQLNSSYYRKYDYGLYCGVSKKFPNQESKYQMNYIIADQRNDRYYDRLEFGSVLTRNLQFYHANNVKGLTNWLLCTAFTIDPNDGPYIRNIPMKKVQLGSKYKSIGIYWRIDRPLPIMKIKLGSNECYNMHKFLEKEFEDD